MATPRSPPTTMVLMPITPPAALTSGPPELPGARVTSARMMGTALPPLRVSAVPSELMIPPVTAPRCPQGCPMASTTWPTCRPCESAINAAGKPLASMCSSARSMFASLATGEQGIPGRLPASPSACRGR